MTKVNIVFQATATKTLMRWEDTPIVYTLRNVPENKDISELCQCISVLFGHNIVRAARLFLDTELTPKNACRFSGIYFTAKKEKDEEIKKAS